METCGDGCEDGNCDCAVTGVAEWPQPRKRKANVSPTCAAGPADDGFDDGLAMKVLGDMVETLRPGTTKSTWTMQDQFHLVIFEWLSQIQPGQSQPHDGLVKAIGVAKAKIAPERIRKLRKDIPKVMSLVADARKSSTAEFKRVVEFVTQISSEEGRQTLISACGGTMERGVADDEIQDARGDEECASECDDGILPNRSVVLIFGLQTERGRPCNHAQGTIESYNTMTQR